MSDGEAIIGVLALCAIFVAAIFVFYLVISEFHDSFALWLVIFVLGFALFAYTVFTYGIAVGFIAIIGCLLAASAAGAPFLLYAGWKDRR